MDLKKTEYQPWNGGTKDNSNGNNYITENEYTQERLRDIFKRDAIR